MNMQFCFNLELNYSMQFHKTWYVGNAENRAFGLETYFRKSDSVTQTQLLFRYRLKFNPLHGGVPDRKTVVNWVRILRSIASINNKPARRKFIDSSYTDRYCT